MTTAIIPVGLIFLIGGLGSPSWSRSELSQLGLWKYCIFSDIFTCCDNLPGGSPDHNRVKDIYMTPINWTKYNQERSLEAWLSHIDPRLDKIEINEASTREKDAIVQLISRTWKPYLAGKGRDAQQRGYSQMKVVKVERIENPSLFLKYAQNRHDLLRRLETTNRPFKFPGMTKHGPIETTANMNKNVFADIYPEINEHYLFHGTSDATVRAIAYGGLDARLAGDGMYGRGIYAAECPTKSDHYTGTAMSNLKMIVVRMLLGEIYVTNVAYPFQRPPCKQCIPGNIDKCNNSAHKHDMFDSVMAALDGKHREFITYEQNRCSSYPEYIITYNRE